MWLRLAGGLRVGSILRFSLRTRADANPPYEVRPRGLNAGILTARLPLFLELLTSLHLGAPELDARRMVDRPLADHLGEQKVGQPLDLVRRQRCGRVGHLETARAQIGKLEAETAPVAISEAIESRHAGAGPAAFDGHDQNLAVERDFPQVRPVRHLAVHLAAIARPAVAGLTVALLQEQLAARRDIV